MSSLGDHVLQQKTTACERFSQYAAFRAPGDVWGFLLTTKGALNPKPSAVVFLNERHPNVDPNISKSLLLGPQKGTPSFEKPQVSIKESEEVHLR